MKKLLSIWLILLSGLCKAQTQYHAIVIDADKNIIARGVFQTVKDSSIVLLVDNLPVSVYYADINLLKIEKNGSSLEFIKAGGALATNLADKALSGGPDTAKKAPLITQQTKEALLNKADLLFAQLLDGANDVATFLIENSFLKFRSKINLMEEYSVDTEVKAQPLKSAGFRGFEVFSPPKLKTGVFNSGPPAPHVSSSSTIKKIPAAKQAKQAGAQNSKQ